MSEVKLDLSKVKVGTRVKMANGNIAKITSPMDSDGRVGHDGIPKYTSPWFCNASDGCSIGGSDPAFSIVEVLDDAPEDDDRQKPEKLAAVVPAIGLLDIFAGCAMQCILANPSENFMSTENVAKLSYDMAEDMMKEKKARVK